MIITMTVRKMTIMKKIVSKERGWGQWEAQIQNLRGRPHVGVFLKGRLTGR